MSPDREPSPEARAILAGHPYKWLRLLRTYIPDWISIPFLRVYTRRKIRRLLIDQEMKQQLLRERATSMESGTPETITAEDIEIFELQSVLAEAETDWFLCRALKQRIPTPQIDDWEETEALKRLKPRPLREFEDAVIKAEREAWKHRREWAALIIALSAAAVSVFNATSTQRRLNDIQGKLSDTQSVLADTQAKLYDTQQKLTDLTEQVRRRELTPGKRGVIPRAR